MFAFLAPILAAMGASLPTILPVLVPLATWAINLFISDQKQREKNKQAFLDAIQSHMNDSVNSANERKNAWQQLQDFKKMEAEADAKAAADAAQKKT